MQTKPYYHQRSAGFSLVELLVSIAVLGIMAAIALVSMSGVNESSRVTAAKAQAQQIASTFEAGKATGAPGFILANSVNSAMNAVGIGSNGSGVNRDAWFQLAGVTAHMDDGKPLDQQAKHYLTWEDGILVYNGSGDLSEPVEPQNPQGPPPGDNWHFIGSAPNAQLAQAVAAQLNQQNPQFEHVAVGTNLWSRPRNQVV